MRRHKQPKKGKEHTHRVPARERQRPMTAAQIDWPSVPDPISPAEVAVLANLKLSLVYKLTRSGQLRCIRIGTNIWVEREALRDYLTGAKKDPPKEAGGRKFASAAELPDVTPLPGRKPVDWRSQPGLT